MLPRSLIVPLNMLFTLLRVCIIERPRLFPWRVNTCQSIYHSKMSKLLVSPNSIINLSPSECIV